ncbi:late histone H2A.1-like [Panulirus ornatus]|uniref:late histone H2A.1-like n=1 Tax=Panulirus ornatus TaxID=150431 RepID=UPI003A8BA015
MVDRGKERKPFKKKFLSELAGLRFPVARIHRYLKAGPYSPRISIGAAVYIAAVLEYLCAEIFELSASVARSFKRMRITPRHIFLAVHHDQELSAIFRDAMAIMNSFVKDMFVRLADEASRLAMLSKRSTLSCRDVEAAVRLVCSGELKLHAASEGTNAFARYTAKN